MSPENKHSDPLPHINTCNKEIYKYGNIFLLHSYSKRDSKVKIYGTMEDFNVERFGRKSLFKSKWGLNSKHIRYFAKM